MKTVIITGANGGLGWATAKCLSKRRYRLILTCRNRDKAERAVETLLKTHPGQDAVPIAMDLGDLSDIERAANEIKTQTVRIDYLVNNAGVFTPPLTFTKDGFESQFGINHLGHFAMTGGFRTVWCQ